jgi:hypothetical protein
MCGFSDEHVSSEEKECGFRYVILYNNNFLSNSFSVLDIQGGMCMLQIFLSGTQPTDVPTI